jgi:FxsC-like protein
VSDNSPYFFLSYAHTPPSGQGGGDPDHWVHTLYRDLCDHIMHLTDLPGGMPAGFMDRELRSGDGWPDRLSEKLATCRVFVPLYSPRYFTSEMCGREWYAFTERIVHAKAAGASDISAIVPILWTRVDIGQFPESVRHIHVEHFGARYADDGIYGLIKLNRLRDEYQEAVLRLAQLIVRVAHDTKLPHGRARPYESTPSAFKPRGSNPRAIHLSVAAPTRDTIPEQRDDRPYGEDALDWNPYHSESTRSLPSLAEELIRSLDYRVTVSSFDDEDTGEALPTTGGPHPVPVAGVDGAEPRRPSILLVDRWVLTDSERQRKLKTFDANTPPWISAVVPWNRSDVQCHGEEGRRLSDELERTLPNILDRGRRTDCRMAVNGVPTLKAFTDVLPAVVTNITRQFLKHAAAHPPAGRGTSRPRLIGPLSPLELGPALNPGEEDDDDGRA